VELSLTSYIHVNQHNIKRNRKHGTDLPVITCKTYKDNRYGKIVKLLHDGQVIAEVVYSPNKPLSCGAEVYIKTKCEVVVDE
jgi:hypothetical protein